MAESIVTMPMYQFERELDFVRLPRDKKIRELEDSLDGTSKLLAEKVTRISALEHELAEAKEQLNSRRADILALQEVVEHVSKEKYAALAEADAMRAVVEAARTLYEEANPQGLEKDEVLVRIGDYNRLQEALDRLEKEKRCPLHKNS